MKTNEEAKQEAIKAAWIKAGFIWDEIKSIIQDDGGLLLENPSLKSTLTGYSESYAKGHLKGYDFAYSGLKVWNNILDGIENNNGWTRIERDRSNLQVGVFKFLIADDCKLNTESDVVHVTQSLIDDPKMAWHVYTHYKPIKEEPKPLY